VTVPAARAEPDISRKRKGSAVAADTKRRFKPAIETLPSTALGGGGNFHLLNDVGE